MHVAHEIIYDIEVKIVNGWFINSVAKSIVQIKLIHKFNKRTDQEASLNSESLIHKIRNNSEEYAICVLIS